MDSDASQFRRDRRSVRNAQTPDQAAEPSSAAVNGETIGWDSEREVVVSASAIPAAAEATWAPPRDAPAAVLPAPSSTSATAAPSAPSAAAAPSAPAPPPVAPSVPTVSARGGESVRLGWDAGQPALYAGEAPASAPVKRGLVSGATVLPEITEAPPAPRRLWKHPAFIVSMITTVLALGVGITLIVLSAVSGGPPRVSGLDVAAGSGSVSLSWGGPNTAYDVYVVGGDGEITDVSQLVRGRDVWIPRSLGYVDDDSCFVVRARSVAGDVSLSADELDAQGAASVCVADAETDE